MPDLELSSGLPALWQHCTVNQTATEAMLQFVALIKFEHLDLFVNSSILFASEALKIF